MYKTDDKLFYLFAVVNLALNKEACQHSNMFDAVASRPVDGNPDPAFRAGSYTYTITVTSGWARWRFKPLASWLFTQPFIQAQIKENIKAPRHWPLWGEFTGDRWIPHKKGQ